MIGQGAS
ncbi:hypothetical protein FOXB_05434 [Fusarium oxysporum f. sp. conglutinans Fo5176]|nr:hypothetical protein FOXB_05434 [Fusarium oxysporum f. sp. conglutinans Fo5176]